MKGISPQPFLLLGALFFCQTLTSCSKKVETGIPVGQFGSLTGAQATFGLSTDKGVQLALEQINGSGGVLGKPIHLITRDNQSKPGETSTTVRELITRDKVVALIGEVASGRSLEAAPIAQRSGIPMISPASTNEKVTEAGDHIFRVCFIDPFQGTVCAKFARKLGAAKVAVLVDVSKDYSLGLAKSFKTEFIKEGGTITGEQSYSGGDKDFSAQLTAIKANNPEVVFLPAYYTEAPLIIRQARQLGITVPFIGGDGWDSTELIGVGGSSVEGCYFSNHFSSQSTEPQVVAFVSAYRKKYNEDPDAMVALGYDALRILADAMKRAGTTDPAKVNAAITTTKDFPGVTGKITLDEHRNPNKPAVILQVKNGKFAYVETIAP
ncbi:MAG: ABC transporter substrate-binding protein [Verrucomicrobia bacterium]|nr:ABC transporter substrate-binding protein [Verrucomicrobiota bacterium]